MNKDQSIREFQLKRYSDKLPMIPDADCKNLTGHFWDLDCVRLLCDFKKSSLFHKKCPFWLILNNALNF